MLISTSYASIGLLLLRIAVGIIFMYHGWPKVRGGKAMAQGMGKPSWGGFMTFLGVAETLGGIGAIIGGLTQAASLGFSLIMLGALRMKISVWHVPFYEQGKGGWETDLLLLGAALCLMLSGAGAYSADALLGWWP